MSKLNIKIFYLLRALVLGVICSVKLLFFTLTPYSMKQKKSVKGEIVLFTGGGSGFGRLLALKFSKLGARVVIWDVNVEGNEETCRLVRNEGGSIDSYILDVSNKDKVYETATLVEKQVGKVTILVNNAGIAQSEAFLNTSDALIEKVMQVNTMAHFWNLKAFLPHMVEINHGHVICVSSVVGLAATPRISAYGSSKHAVIGFMDSISFDLIDSGKTGVKTTVVCPYFSQTSFFECKYDGVIPFVPPELVVEEIIKGVLTIKEKVCVPNLALVIGIGKVILTIILYNICMPLVGPELMSTIKMKKVFKKQE